MAATTSDLIHAHGCLFAAHVIANSLWEEDGGTDLRDQLHFAADALKKESRLLKCAGRAIDLLEDAVGAKATLDDLEWERLESGIYLAMAACKRAILRRTRS